MIYGTRDEHKSGALRPPEHMHARPAQSRFAVVNNHHGEYGDLTGPETGKTAEHRLDVDLAFLLRLVWHWLYRSRQGVNHHHPGICLHPPATSWPCCCYWSSSEDFLCRVGKGGSTCSRHHPRPLAIRQCIRVRCTLSILRKHAAWI